MSVKCLTTMQDTNDPISAEYQMDVNTTTLDTTII